MVVVEEEKHSRVSTEKLNFEPPTLVGGLTNKTLDNVHHYAHICEVISVRLVMAVTSYPIFSHHGDHDEQVK